MLELHYPTVTKTILERQYPGKPTLKVAFGNGNGAIFENSSKLRASLFSRFTAVKRVKFAKVKRNTLKLRLLLSLSKV